MNNKEIADNVATGSTMIVLALVIYGVGCAIVVERTKKSTDLMVEDERE